jgi:hypothetical protein
VRADLNVRSAVTADVDGDPKGPPSTGARISARGR